MECISSLMSLVIGAIIAFPCKSNSSGMNERFRVGIIYIHFVHYGNSDSLNFQGTTSKDCESDNSFNLPSTFEYILTE